MKNFIKKTKCMKISLKKFVKIFYKTNIYFFNENFLKHFLKTEIFENLLKSEIFENLKNFLKFLIVLKRFLQISGENLFKTIIFKNLNF